MTHDAAILKAQKIATGVLASSAGQNDKEGRFSAEAIELLGESGLLGLMLPVNVGGAASRRSPRQMLRSRWSILCTFSAPPRSRRRAQAPLSQSRLYCTRSLRVAIYPRWLLVKPARAAISGRPHRARIEMETECESVPGNHG